MTGKRIKSRIAVKRIAPVGDDPTRVRLTFNFDTKSLGPERTQRIWQGVGMIIAGVLDEDEVREFQRKIAAMQKKQPLKRGTK